MNNTTNVMELALKVRKHSLYMVNKANASHIGTSLSIVDILAVLYDKILKINPLDPNWSDRDRFILSKGHGCAALYAVLAEKGFFPLDWLETYCQDGGHLAGHITHMAPGVEVSTGSLGHGLSIGCGMAINSKRNNNSYRVFVLLGDGECDEGSIWEAALFAAHHHLDNLVAIVDCNKIQAFGRTSEVINLDPLIDKWKAFGWAASEVDGHDYEKIYQSLIKIPIKTDHPTCLIMNTIKGKGVSFMENNLAWHYKSPNKEQLNLAITELEELK